MRIEFLVIVVTYCVYRHQHATDLVPRLVPEIPTTEAKNESFDRALDGGAASCIRSRRSIQHCSLRDLETGGCSARNHLESCGHKREQTRISVLPSRNKSVFRSFGGVRQMQSTKADNWFTAR